MYADVRHVFKQNINGMPKMTTITEIIHNEIYYLPLTFPKLVASVRLQKMRTQMP